MNPVNGLVSRQFHVKFDDTFETLTQQNLSVSWPTLAGFGVEKAAALPKAVPKSQTISSTTREVEDEVQELQDGPDFTHVTNDDEQSESSDDDEDLPEEEIEEGRHRSGHVRFSSRKVKESEEKVAVKMRKRQE